MKLGKTEYNTIHVWVLRHYKKTGFCEHCALKVKTQWSNRTGNYLRQRDDWQELCYSCHRSYDIEKLGYIPFGGKTKRPHIKREDLNRMRSYPWWNIDTEYFKVID